MFEKFGIVRDYDNEFILAHLFQKRRDFLARLDVEVARGFVRKNNGRVFCESACNDSSLFFSARKFAAALIDLLCEPYAVYQFFCSLSALYLVIEAKERKFYVFKYGEVFDDIEILKNRSDILFAILFPFRFGIARLCTAPLLHRYRSRR